LISSSAELMTLMDDIGRLAAADPLPLGAACPV
jgi:hypothetical protein